MAGVAVIPPETKPKKLATEIQGLLSDYKPATASHVRTDFIADSKKMRKATSILREDLTEEESDRLLANVNQERRGKTPRLLNKAQNTLRQLCTNQEVLPDGTAIASITSLDNCNLLIRIVQRATIDYGRTVASLWEEGNGVLHGIRFTKRALEKA